MTTARQFLTATFLAATAFCGSAAGAQKFVRQDSVRALPAPVLLETAGMFQERYAKVGDDMFIAGQPTEKALREIAETDEFNRERIARVYGIEIDEKHSN